MPAESEKQRLHLVKLNALSQTKANQFKNGESITSDGSMGKSAYKAPLCGHLTSNPNGARCRPCHCKSMQKNGPTFLRTTAIEFTIKMVSSALNMSSLAKTY